MRKSELDRGTNNRRRPRKNPPDDFVLGTDRRVLVFGFGEALGECFFGLDAPDGFGVAFFAMVFFAADFFTTDVFLATDTVERFFGAAVFFVLRFVGGQDDCLATFDVERRVDRLFFFVVPLRLGVSISTVILLMAVWLC